MEASRELGIVGLGRMGGGLALQALDKGMRVAGFTKGGAPAELVKAGLAEADRLQGLVAALARPRAIFLYLPAGPVVDEVLDALAARVSRGDVLVDGGNSYWRDSRRRARRLARRGVHLVDVGTSGGVEDTGEVGWLVEDALRMEVPAPVIAQSVMQLFLSRDAEKPWARAVAAMRHGFGGHPFGPAPEIARERRVGRVDRGPEEGPTPSEEG